MKAGGEARGKKKCAACRGKGGEYVHSRRFGVDIWQPCRDCAGKGGWWPKGGANREGVACLTHWS
jgi:DnaJ-class molecular chaperone